MKSSRQWIVYSLIRIGMFAVVLAVLLLLEVNPWISAIAAAIIALCASYIFLGRNRDAVASSIVELRAAKDHDADNDLENAALDQAEGKQP